MVTTTGRTLSVKGAGFSANYGLAPGTHRAARATQGQPLSGCTPSPPHTHTARTRTVKCCRDGESSMTKKRIQRTEQLRKNTEIQSRRVVPGAVRTLRTTNFQIKLTWDRFLRNSTADNGSNHFSLFDPIGWVE